MQQQNILFRLPHHIVCISFCCGLVNLILWCQYVIWPSDLSYRETNTWSIPLSTPGCVKIHIPRMLIEDANIFLSLSTKGRAFQETSLISFPSAIFVQN